jgi:hypothetical protein
MTKTTEVTLVGRYATVLIKDGTFIRYHIHHNDKPWSIGTLIALRDDLTTLIAQAQSELLNVSESASR